MIRSSAKSVNMGCIERVECPLLFMNNVIDWGIEDPKGKSIEKVREIRDEIDRRVIEIAQSLEGQDSRLKLTIHRKGLLPSNRDIHSCSISYRFSRNRRQVRRQLGLAFIAFAPFVGVAIGVYLFGKISMAHFNPAVTLAFLITGHITKLQLLHIFDSRDYRRTFSELFVMTLIGTEASLGANTPDYSSYPLPLVFGIEVLATAC